jgi:hypothetical protein
MLLTVPVQPGLGVAARVALLKFDELIRLLEYLRSVVSVIPNR